MKFARFAIAAAAAIPWLIGALASPGADTTRAARDLVAALRPAQRTALVQPFEGEERIRWSYFPGRRPGIALKDLEPSERAAVFALLRRAHRLQQIAAGRNREELEHSVRIGSGDRGFRLTGPFAGVVGNQSEHVLRGGPARAEELTGD